VELGIVDEVALRIEDALVDLVGVLIFDGLGVAPLIE